ncbi:Na+/H+ antiporter NhaC family protein [Paenisporosarcina cavernae]|uniref:Na+/H+ antiporter NhaC family protein n=1 Tax=Paenisporosarcina cavernae TaxID=2320858 RepID=A0A385YTV4_9BACL|nr:Na+/H+ antiporter NhaC family protein [Paenisporosarcina cavernae]AYC29974.1 Na+/H+ antiporter NhaC family protein [Paenisporosarcina cavernae]
MSGTIWSILPPIIAIALVLITRKVLLSLGVGIILGALLTHSFAPVDSFLTVWNSFKVTFWDDGFNAYNVFIILFLLLLGVITAFVSLSGGSRAFAEWAVKRIQTRRGARLLTAVLGIVIFIDDYFNALAVGQIARPITDHHKISRAKLAYFIDSTSAPVCVVSPVSSWGAYLIGLIGTILATQTAITLSPLSAFVLMAPMNFYVIAALAIVFFVAVTDFDLLEMKKHEMRAVATGEVYDPEKDIPGQLKEEFPVHRHGKVRDLILPIVTLVVVTIGMMMWTGSQNALAGNVDVTLWSIFENTDVPKSLLIGGIAGSVMSMLLYAIQIPRHDHAETKFVAKGIWSGVQSMIPAVLILLFAWSLTFIIADLGTGEYLAAFVEKANIPVGLIPVLLFVLAGGMAFATGTSWGSFGILLPIAGTIMINSEPELLLPALAAVLAGSVFGDHCSPISDTTILSSTGAGCNHIDHVATQLPYALISAAIAGAGYLILGLTGSIWLGLVGVIVILVILFFIWGTQGKNNVQAVKEEQNA